MNNQSSKKNNPVKHLTGTHILTAFTPNGNKVVIFEEKDTLFGPVNHVWKYEKEEEVMDVRESPKPPKYDLPITLDKPFHKPHLENFFAAIRGEEKLNCPAEIGYETAVMVLKVNDAVKAGQKLEFKPEEFKV